MSDVLQTYLAERKGEGIDDHERAIAETSRRLGLDPDAVVVFLVAALDDAAADETEAQS